MPTVGGGVRRAWLVGALTLRMLATGSALAGGNQPDATPDDNVVTVDLIIV
jgi:hypothetical protein